MRHTLVRAAALSAVLLAAVSSNASAAVSNLVSDTLAGVTGSALIPNQYIITLRKPPAGDALAALPLAQQVDTLLSGIGGGELLHVYSFALRGFSARMLPLQATLLRLNPLVAQVEQDMMHHIVTTETGATWGLDRIDQRALPLNSQYTYPDQAGEGVHVYIIDTGINPNHNEFTGRVGTSQNFVTSGGFLFTPGTRDPNAWTDCNGHGSHVAGTIAGTTWGVAKKATVHAIRVLDCNGSGTGADILAGIDYVVQNHQSPAVANMSLGTVSGRDQSEETAVHNMYNAGITVAVAAGNSSANACNTSPAAEPTAITVGATESNDAMASYSNFGSCVDIFAPGSNITSVDYSNNTGSKQLSGTSMATPHVVGVAALILGANPGFTPAQVAAQLDADSSKNTVTSIGAGSPNKLLYVASSTGTPGVDNPPVASFTVSCGNLACNFSGAGSTDDKGIAAYAWNFGDSTSGNGVSVAHTYAAAGTYSVTLTVTDTVSQTNGKTQAVTVTAAASGPCSDCTKISGTLASGGTAYSPTANGFSSAGGQFKGYLRGPAGTDFDLYLEKLSSGLLGSGWSSVASGQTTGSSEDVVYSGTAGTYRWRITSYSGAGNYDFYFKNP